MTAHSDEEEDLPGPEDPGDPGPEDGPAQIEAGTEEAQDAIEAYLEGQNVVTAVDVAVQALGYGEEQASTHVLQKVGAVLRELGWRKGQSRGAPGSRPRRIWIREGHDPDGADLSAAGFPPAAAAESDIVSLLKSLNEAVQYSVDIQNKIAENLIYIRDQGDDLRSRVEAVEERISRIESAKAPSSEALVSSVKEAVRGVLETDARRSDVTRATSLLEVSENLSAEIRQLCEAAKDIVSGVKDG